MGMLSGLTIDGKHTHTDFNLIMESYRIPEPEVKRSAIDIPFASGSIDVTDAAGTTPYMDREGLEFVFNVVDGGHELWAKKVQELAMFMHGKKFKIILDYDPQYYYLARLHVNHEKSSRVTGRIVLEGTSDPFKYALIASNEPWHWDPFSFIDGEIMETTSDITVDGTKDVLIRAGGVDVSPTFYVFNSQGLAVVHDDIAYQLTKDNPSKAYEVYRFPQIKVGSEDKILTFIGKGKVSIEYRGRFL